MQVRGDLSGLAVIAGSGLLAWPISYLARVDRRTFLPPMMFNNSGNMGLPLAVFALGDQALAPAVALFVISNLAQFIVGVKLVYPRASLRGVLVHPLVLASAARDKPPPCRTNRVTLESITTHPPKYFPSRSTA